MTSTRLGFSGRSTDCEIASSQVGGSREALQASWMGPFFGSLEEEGGGFEMGWVGCVVRWWLLLW